MNNSVLLLVVNQNCDQSIQWVWDQLTRAGLQVIRTFDLKDARAAHIECTCPHHGTDACDCQLVVLLVYSGKRPPLSLVAHGHDNQTWFYVVNTPQQKADPRLELTIRQTLVQPATDLLSGSLPQPAA